MKSGSLTGRQVPFARVEINILVAAAERGEQPAPLLLHPVLHSLDLRVREARGVGEDEQPVGGKALPGHVAVVDDLVVHPGGLKNVLPAPEVALVLFGPEIEAADRRRAGRVVYPEELFGIGGIEYGDPASTGLVRDSC